MRKNIIAGNWKMNKTASQASEFLSSVASRMDSKDEVVIFPPYLSVAAAVAALKGTKVRVGVQNMHFEDAGAFTGEVSADMVLESGCEYVLIGHSERRKYFAETDETVNLKVKKALAKGLIPMVCVGEDLDEREKDLTFDVIARQLRRGLEGVAPSSVVIAYEPVWAIGTGKTATDEQAQEVCAFIRKSLSEMGFDAAEISILYGGSVKGSNITSLMSMPDIDGALVGGAALTEDFINIINY
ncbi:MAG: triose-phosphate isomerase [Eubacteriaceae bacterium]|nr:triose-phosphate isomerase [Eubacteriaceae bacterium]MCR4894943.1 triose-phosphate isomerase [Eubacteriales bacterium]